MRATRVGNDVPVTFRVDMLDPDLELNLTAHPSMLGPNEAPVVIGRDVVHFGRMAPDGGRKPVGETLSPGANEHLVDAVGSDMNGATYLRYKNVYTSTDFVSTGTSLTRKTGSWPTEMVGSYIYIDNDNRSGTSQVRKISSITTSGSYSANDTLNWTNSVTWPTPNFAKIEIVYQDSFDKRGIWATNGRKFWLLQGGSWVEFLDMGSDSYLTKRWGLCRISYDRILLVSDEFPARVIHLNASSGATVSNTDHTNLAGIISPVKSDDLEQPYDSLVGNHSWWTSGISTTGGYMSNGTYYVYVRAVNLNENLHSKAVPVYPNVPNNRAIVLTGGTSTQKFGIGQYVDASIANAQSDAQLAPPVSNRWTHIEVIRTPSTGVGYYIEKRIPVVATDNESRMGNVPDVLASLSANCCMMSDVELMSQTQVSASDLLGGYPVPLCKKAVNVNGVTFCFGAGAEGGATIQALSHVHPLEGTVRHDWNTGTGQFDENPDPGAGFRYFNYFSKTTNRQFVWTSPAGGVGTYNVTWAAGGKIGLVSGPGSNYNDVRGYFVDTHEIEWPKIDSDEDVWVSRSDTYSPESFQIANENGSSRITRLSGKGDVFKNAVVAGNYACAIMEQGVHLLWPVGSDIYKDTIAEDGTGTPWAESVCSYENTVVWARADGPRMMQVSNSPNDKGHRGTIIHLDPEGKLLAWFESAYKGGYRVDAGIDMKNMCVRFRKTISSNSNYFESLQYSFKTGKWTVIEDDSGKLFVNSRYADTTVEDTKLFYSVSVYGNVFEENYYGTSHPYDTKTVQAKATVAAGYTVTTTSITKAGAFSADMIGDIIRFRSATATVDGQYRQIYNATTDVINFGAVTGLAAGDEFIIGASRFRVRSGPLPGSSKRSVKTIFGHTLVAVTGQRNVDNANWPDPPTGKFTSRAYEDFADTPVSEDEYDSENAVGGIPIYKNSDSGFVEKDRVSSIEGQGAFLQVEIENIESRSDFHVAVHECVVIEESDELLDQESS